MRTVVLTQRVAVEPATGERRDALDQRWAELLLATGLLPIPLPNAVADVGGFFEGTHPVGAVLTGGNDLASYGGDAPERDEVERKLLHYCIRKRLPVLGVCRGMELFQDYFGGRLERVDGHVTARLEVMCEGQPRTINSYHRLGFRQATPEFEIWACASDRVIKAVRHRDLPLVGIMWHPERNQPFEAQDLKLLQELFG